MKDDLAAYLTRFPARSVQLPWNRIAGEQHEVPLVLSTRETTALNRNYFNTYVWKKALRAVGVPDTRENGSTLLDAGESIKALRGYLGHADPGFTLRTYTHLMPSSDERTGRAVDAVLCVPDVYPADSPPADAQVRGDI